MEKLINKKANFFQNVFENCSLDSDPELELESEPEPEPKP
jgi:hypothetical protein